MTEAVLVELRSRVAAALECRESVFLDTVSSALFTRGSPYQRLGGVGATTAMRADAREVLSYLVQIVDQRNPQDETEIIGLVRFRCVGAERARQGLPFDSLTELVEIGQATVWAFVGEALSDAEPTAARDLALELAPQVIRASRQMADGLALGHASESDRGSDRWRRSVADFVARAVDGIWGDEREMHRAAQHLGSDLTGRWLLLLLARQDGRSDGRFAAPIGALEAEFPDLLTGPSRRVPTPHVPLLYRLGDDDLLSVHLHTAGKIADDCGVLLLVSDIVPSWTALPPVYRREAAAIACARATGRATGVVGGTDTALYRLLQQLPVTVRVEYVRDVMAPVVEEQTPLKTDQALAALEAYFRVSGRLDKAAAELGLPRNSYKYRLERAQTLLGVDFRLGSDRQRVELALATRRLMLEEALLLDRTG